MFTLFKICDCSNKPAEFHGFYPWVSTVVINSIIAKKLNEHLLSIPGKLEDMLNEFKLRGCATFGGPPMIPVYISSYEDEVWQHYPAVKQAFNVLFHAWELAIDKVRTVHHEKLSMWEILHREPDSKRTEYEISEMKLSLGNTAENFLRAEHEFLNVLYDNKVSLEYLKYECVYL